MKRNKTFKFIWDNSWYLLLMVPVVLIFHLITPLNPSDIKFISYFYLAVITLRVAGLYIQRKRQRRL